MPTVHESVSGLIIPIVFKNSTYEERGTCSWMKTQVRTQRVLTKRFTSNTHILDKNKRRNVGGTDTILDSSGRR